MNLSQPLESLTENFKLNSANSRYSNIFTEKYVFILFILNFLSLLFKKKIYISFLTKQDDTVVTCWAVIQEVPSLNPSADQPNWGFFVISLSLQGKCWIRFSFP